VTPAGGQARRALSHRATAILPIPHRRPAESLTDILAITFLGIPLSSYLLVALAAAGASIIGGVAGYGGGLLLPLVLVPVIGPEATVPVLGVTAIFTNLGRVAAFWKDIDWPLVWRIALPAAPGVVLGASFNAWLSGPGVLILLGLTMLAMLPARRWLEARSLVISLRILPFAGFALGVLVGGTTGSGVIFIGVLSGLGLAGAALIATDAAGSVITGAVKSLTFGTLGTLTPELAVFAIVIGCVTFPAGFVARALLRLIPMKIHTWIMDAVIVIGGLGLLIRGLRGG
jgi:uncharacterized protein